MQVIGLPHVIRSAGGGAMPLPGGAAPWRRTHGKPGCGGCGDQSSVKGRMRLIFLAEFGCFSGLILPGF